MKTLDEILKQEPVLLNDWKNEGVERVFDDFEFNPKGEKIIFASYTYEDYSGDAYVLFEKDGILYEVNGGHCSCYGLEGQWEPEEVSLNRLENTLTNGTFGDNEFRDELRKIMGI